MAHKQRAVSESQPKDSKSLTLDVELAEDWLIIVINGLEILRTPNTPKVIENMKVDFYDL